MSGTAAPPAPGLRCRKCAAPFGTAVAFCPFCGRDQTVPTVQKTAETQRLADAEKRAEAESLAAAQKLGAQLRKGSVPPVEPEPPDDAPAPPVPPAKARRPRRTSGRPGWRRWLAVLGLTGLAIAYIMLRLGPTGTLIVHAAPGVAGNVTVDGTLAGPPGEALTLAEGVHHLGYDADGWTAAERDVTIAAGEQRVVTLVLTPRPATISFDVQTPGTALRLDGRPLDPAQGSVEVAAGRHRIVATHPGFAALILEPVLERGERRSIPITLAPIAVRQMTLTAPVTGWSEPVPLPPHTSFTIAAGSRLRLRIGQEVLLVQAGAQTSLGDVRGQSLQVKAVDDQPVEVHVFLRPDG